MKHPSIPNPISTLSAIWKEYLFSWVDFLYLVWYSKGYRLQGAEFVIILLGADINTLNKKLWKLYLKNHTKLNTSMVIIFVKGNKILDWYKKVENNIFKQACVMLRILRYRMESVLIFQANNKRFKLVSMTSRKIISHIRLQSTFLLLHYQWLTLYVKSDQCNTNISSFKK